MQYVKMTLTEVRDSGRGGHIWSFEGDYKFGVDEESIFREVDKKGIYYSDNEGLVVGLYIIFDLHNDNVRDELKENTGWFVQLLNGFIRQGKIETLLDGEV